MLGYVTTGCNRTAAPFASEPGSDTAHALLDAAAAATPTAVALCTAGAAAPADRVTYAELASRAFQLAVALAELRLPREDNRLIGLLTERSTAAVVAIFGILKAGGTYVPLDVGFPRKRIKEIVDDARCPAVLLESDQLAGKLCAGLAAALLVFGAAGELRACEGQRARLEALPARRWAGPLHTTGSSLVYVMYTSGSTGKPKGVMVRHAELLMRVTWMQAALTPAAPQPEP